MTTVDSRSSRSPVLGPAAERRITSRVNWSAILAGVAVSIGVWVMLHLLGMGIGLTAIDPDDAGTLKGAGIGTGVWSTIAPILALFLGGVVTGRVAGIFDRGLNAIHGSVVWALTTVAGMTVLVMGLSALVGTTAGLAGDAVKGTAGLAAKTAAGIDGDDGKKVMDALGLSDEELLAPLNRELREQGKPAVTASQLQAATKDVVGDAFKSGQLDRATLTRSIADHTSLTRNQASDLGAQIEQRWTERKSQIAGLANAARTAALQAAETTGKGLLLVFTAMLLALIAAAGGVILGASLWRRQITRATGRPVS